MAESYVFGDTATLTLPTGTGSKWAAFSIGVTQSIAEAVSLGETWVTTRGMVKRASVNLTGFVTTGAANVSGVAALVAASAAFVGTFKTGDTLGGNVVFGDLNLSASVEDASRKTMSGRFDGAITETWA